jgi:hypothetical protein
VPIHSLPQSRSVPVSIERLKRNGAALHWLTKGQRGRLPIESRRFQFRHETTLSGAIKRILGRIEIDHVPLSKQKRPMYRQKWRH